MCTAILIINKVRIQHSGRWLELPKPQDYLNFTLKRKQQQTSEFSMVINIQIVNERLLTFDNNNISAVSNVMQAANVRRSNITDIIVVDLVYFIIKLTGL